MKLTPENLDYEDCRPPKGNPNLDLAPPEVRRMIEDRRAAMAVKPRAASTAPEPSRGH